MADKVLSLNMFYPINRNSVLTFFLFGCIMYKELDYWMSVNDRRKLTISDCLIEPVRQMGMWISRIQGCSEPFEVFTNLTMSPPHTVCYEQHLL